MWRKTDKIITLMILFLGATCATAGDKKTSQAEKQPSKDKYAIVVSAVTSKDGKWMEVAEALKKKHQAKFDVRVFIYEDKLQSVKPELSKFSPKYICFVATPKEAGGLVPAVHQLTRELDDDPYGDAIWAILTGYDVEDALRIAKENKPLQVKRGVSTVCNWLDCLKEGITYSEITDKMYQVKDETTGGKVETKNDGQLDVTGLFVEQINKNNVDTIWTSSHATEHDFSGFRHNRKTGQIVSGQGKLTAIDMSGKRYKINSNNPKVYLACGNCSIGHISDKNCMALAWIHSGGVYQFMGYTVGTWYGFMGWGIGTYFYQYGGKFTLAESFYINNQMLLFNLKHNLAEGDEADGHNYDKDVVALYGDPGWDARVYTGPDAVTSKPLMEMDIKEKGKDGDKVTFEFAVKFNNGIDSSAKIPGGCGPFAFLPVRVTEPEVIDKGDADIVEITEGFIIVKFPGTIPAGTEKKIVFKAKVLQP